MVVAADREQWAGVIGVINSVRRNCAQPARLRVHVVVTAGTEGAFGAFLRCHAVAREHLEVLGFSAARLPETSFVGIGGVRWVVLAQDYSR